MTPADAIDELRTRGAVVMRRAFDPAAIAGLLENVANHAGAVASGRTQFPAFYRWSAFNLTCDVTALDPATRDAQSSDFNATTLHRAIMTGTMQAILRDQVGPELGYAWVRARTILPNAITGSTGELPLHQEKTAIQFPGVHVIWAPLTPLGVVVNRDAPGLRLKLSGGETIRPEMEAGDLILFNGDVPHATFIPETGGNRWRVGCDIRIFPWTDENHLPPVAIKDGHRPERLVTSLR